VSKADRIRYLLKTPSAWKLALSKLRVQKQRASILEILSRLPGGDQLRAEFYPVEHHIAHLASAYHFSDFQDSVVLSVDGFGDFSSAAWGEALNGEIHIQRKVPFPHSLGLFYETVTQFIGFPHYGDEYKVMGLASYGKPIYLNEMREIAYTENDGGYKLNMRYFLHQTGKAKYGIDKGIPRSENFFSEEWTKLLGKHRAPGEELTQRHKDIAASAQAIYEENLFHLLNKIAANTSIRNLSFAGGCAMNSVANGKIAENTPFKSIYIPPAAGDAGGSVGAAAFTHWQKTKLRCKPMNNASLGYQATDIEIKELLNQYSDKLETQGITIKIYENEHQLCNAVSDEIIRGSVVGWYQGRMEWGPRALGARSILCDPRRADAKDLLNGKIKRRESFRPFAPSICRENVHEWFEADTDVPFMMQVLPIREEKRTEVPAITHVDGSGRLQTVTAQHNSIYYKLIRAFGDKTGVPILLNTSFNENEPIVCKPQEAIECFLRTNMDVLVLNNIVVQRNT